MPLTRGMVAESVNQLVPDGRKLGYQQRFIKGDPNILYDQEATIEIINV